MVVLEVLNDLKLRIDNLLLYLWIQSDLDVVSVTEAALELKTVYDKYENLLFLVLFSENLAFYTAKSG